MQGNEIIGVLSGYSVYQTFNGSRYIEQNNKKAWLNKNNSVLPIVKSRNQQMKEERVVAEYVQMMLNLNYGIDVDNVNTKYEQINGIDAIMRFTDGDIYFDEKANLSYIASQLTTFALELFGTGRSNGHNIYKGGFWEDSKSTHLMLIYIEKGSDYINDISDIESATAIFVKKEAIRNYLKGIGLDKDRCYQIANCIFNQNHKSGYTERHGDVRFNYYEGEYEAGKIEKSVSIIIRRDILEGIADAVFEL